MKIRLLLSCISLFAAVSLRAQGHELDAIIEAEKAAFPGCGNALKSAAIDNADFTYHRCEWQVDPAVDFISGAVTTHFIPDAPITVLEFDCSDSLTVDSVKHHGTALAFSRPGGHLLRVSLPGALPSGTLDSITVWYHGVPSNSGFGSFIQSSHGPSSTPIVWTLSEPFGARDWWPCKQGLTDKVDSLDVIITCPDAYRAASNGVLASSTTASGFRTHHWRHRHPIATYLICMAVTDYVIYSDWVVEGTDSIEVLNYVFPEDLTSAMAGTASTATYMQLFDSLFGLYPFADEKYGHAQFGWGGGMEHQTMTFMGGWGGELINHELAHHWFGDLITCGSWSEIWLNESFATYCTSLCYEFRDPAWLIAFRKGCISSVTSQPDGSVFCTDTTDVGRIFSGRLTYRKGCMLLTTLRWTIGDSAFFAGMSAYVNDPSVRDGFSRTSIWQAHMEAACGCDLTSFMDDWYWGQGHPSYQIAWRQDTANLLTLTVSQTQSHPSVSFYEVKLPILLRSTTGLDSLIVVDHVSNGQTFTLTPGFRVDSLFLDPQKVIITAANSIVHADAPAATTLSVMAFPNPAQGSVSLRTGERLTAGKLYTLQGALVRELSAAELASKKADISGLSAGAYLLSLRAGDREATVKLEVQ